MTPREEQKPAPPSRQEQSIDEMVEETFPASDATQLPGRAGGAPEPGAERPDARREFAGTTPRTIGNQGIAPATRQGEERVPLGGAGVVVFRLGHDGHALTVRFSDDCATLDAAAVDRLIAALSEKRTQMR